MKKNNAKFSIDFKAGFTVFLVAIPLCLGIALASGAPVLSGLIAGIVGGIVVGFFSGSHLSVSGPAAGLVAVMLAANAELGSYDVVLTALCFAGMLQIVLGYLGAGVIAHFIPSSVVKGMLAGIGVILILKQIPHALGYDGVYEGSLSFLQADGENTFSEIFKIFDHLSTGPIIISSLSFVLLLLFNRKEFQNFFLFKYLPVSLIVIAIASFVNYLFGIYSPEIAISKEHLVQLPDLLGANSFSDIMVFPDFSAFSNILIYKHGIIIALIASVETLLCIEATDKLDPHKRITPTNKELKAQGIGNIVSGLIGGLPITSVIVRSSVNIENKATSKNSTIMHGVFLVISLVIAKPLIDMIPLASLASILILIGYKLTNRKLVKDMFNKGMNQFIPFVVTIFAILFTDLLVGVCVGLIVAVVMVLKNYYMLQTFELKEIKEGNNQYKVTFLSYTTFLYKASLEKTLRSIAPGSKVELDFSSMSMIDPEVSDMLEDFYVFADENDIKLSITPAKVQGIVPMKSNS